MSATRPRSQVDQAATPKPAEVMPTSLPEIEAAEIPRRHSAFLQELRPSGEVSAFLVLRATILSVRMERCVEYENATLAERVRRAILDFVPPEGMTDPAEIARLRTEAGTRAVFDTSEAAAQARRYEAASERSFYRALKELRLVERAARAAEEEASEAFIDETLASILPPAGLAEEFAAMDREERAGASRSPAGSSPRPDLGALGGRFDVPITIGRRR